MGASTVVSDYFSGQGVVLLATKDATTGEPEGFIDVGNVSSLMISNNVSVFEHKESRTGNRSIDLRLSTETKVNVAMVMESLNTTNLEVALRASRTVVAAGSITDESVTAKLGKIISLSKIKIDTVVVTDNTGATTYEVDKNYRLNEEVGSIEVFTDADQTAKGAAANITADQELYVDFNYAAQYTIDAMVNGRQDRWVRFEGLNTAQSNEPVVVDIFKYGMDPLQQLALINDEIAQASIEGSALSDDTRTTGSKYYKVTSLDA